ncbi:hypothetical protein SAMN05445060_0032 [Williamsia sterculiae]|uniref:Uncharacterized protein n=2 Tax=Williamsia sterculiae TaxID=1344003 RepID=A0A1N7CC58_9NOCA|nr:hypothetical protein SAMN05445060_0032 [Williamsia sterculiae]
MTHAVPDRPDLWSSEHWRLNYFENRAAEHAETAGEDYAELISVSDGEPGCVATITYRVVTAV